MVSTRRGKRKKEEALQQTHPNFDNTDEDYPYFPPNSVQFTSSSSPLRTHLLNTKKCIHSHPTTLKAAIRVLKEPHLRNTSPNVNPELVHEHPVKVEVKTPELSDWILAVQRPQEVQKERPDPMHQDIPSSRDNNVISHVQEVIPEKSTTKNVARSSQCLSTSLNITEFAKRQLDDDDDNDEVQSALESAFDCVNGHKVNKEHAPLLRAIFDKYGDISKETKGQPPTIISCFLERVCAIYERLKGTKFSKVTRKDLNELLDEVRYLESQKLNLRWLHEKLEHIYNTKISSPKYLTAKEEGKKGDTIVRSLEDALDEKKREVSLIEEQLAAAKEKVDQCKKVARDIKARVDELSSRSLVHGLL